LNIRLARLGVTEIGNDDVFRIQGHGDLLSLTIYHQVLECFVLAAGLGAWYRVINSAVSLPQSLEEPMHPLESSLEALANRVERLERQYHRIQSELTTEKVVLVDADGKTRATLRMSEGEPGFILYDNDENVCAILRVSDEGPALHLVHSKTKAGLELKVSDSGPDVSLFDASGKERLRLGVTTYASGTPYLGMLDPNGMQTLMVTSLDNGPSINLSDPANANGNTVVRLQVDGDGPQLKCLKDGKFLWYAP
jgi:hypothetical protein